MLQSCWSFLACQKVPIYNTTALLEHVTWHAPAAHTVHAVLRDAMLLAISNTFILSEFSPSKGIYNYMNQSPIPAVLETFV